MSGAGVDAWWEQELVLLRQTCMLTPEERMAWLEEALDFAMQVGALEKTRRAQATLRSRERAGRKTGGGRTAP